MGLGGLKPPAFFFVSSITVIQGLAAISQILCSTHHTKKKNNRIPSFDSDKPSFLQSRIRWIERSAIVPIGRIINDIMYYEMCLAELPRLQWHLPPEQNEVDR